MSVVSAVGTAQCSVGQRIKMLAISALGVLPRSLLEPRGEDRHQDNCCRHQHPVLEMDAEECKFPDQPVAHLGSPHSETGYLKVIFMRRATANSAAYGLIAAGIAVIIIPVVKGLGTNLKGTIRIGSQAP
jgi:hypothetical protein